MPSNLLLYRFMSERWGLESIVFRRFRISRFQELNDPFEMRFGIFADDAEGHRYARFASDTFLETVNQSIGVICYSGSAKEPVLWAHYANNHQGMAFEVDHSDDVVEKVHYSDERVILNCSGKKTVTELGEDHFFPLIMQMRLRKSRGWRYEDEYRQFLKLEDGPKAEKHQFVALPDGFLKRVSLGMKCRFSEDEIRKTLDSVGLESTQVVRAQCCTVTYQVLF